LNDFSKRRWSGGCLTALAAGAVVNMLPISIGLKINVTTIATLLSMIPGIVMMIIGKKMERRDFGQGLLAGGCVVALLGGLCGGIFTATQVKH
jgi:uncharacterized membrane protein YdjX (TVP38/TMEM64 family)